MAGSLKLFGVYASYVNGELLSYSTSVEFHTDNKDADVEVLIGDYVGVTPAPKKLMASVTVHDPVGGTLLSRLQAKENANEFIKMKFVDLGNGKTMDSEGNVRNVSGSVSVGQTADIKFDFVGLPAQFQ
jgi:hypothetical protein